MLKGDKFSWKLILVGLTFTWFYFCRCKFCHILWSLFVWLWDLRQNSRRTFFCCSCCFDIVRCTKLAYTLINYLKSRIEKLLETNSPTDRSKCFCTKTFNNL